MLGQDIKSYLNEWTNQTSDGSKRLLGIGPRPALERQDPTHNRLTPQGELGTGDAHFASLVPRVVPNPRPCESVVISYRIFGGPRLPLGRNARVCQWEVLASRQSER
jgi:hypothetical protein